MPSDVTMEEAKNALRSRADGCFMCKWILEDLEIHGELTDYPPNVNIPEKAVFPAKAKVEHLKLEKIITPEA